MSKTSHSRHEHKAHPHHKHVEPETVEPNYAQEHSKLVLAIVIIFLIVAPLFFAAMSIFDWF